MVLGSVIQCLFCFRDDSETPGSPTVVHHGPASLHPLAEGKLPPVPPQNPTDQGTIHGSQDVITTPLAGVHDAHSLRARTPEPRPAERPDSEVRELLDELAKHSALDARSNAEGRAYAARCDPGTRAKILDDLEQWSDGKGPWSDKRMLILTGPAGHGKPAIMQSLCENLVKLPKDPERRPSLVLATFFFKESLPEQNHARRLIPTLAFQAADQCRVKYPSVRQHIVDAIAVDRGLFTKALEHQLDPLLVNPCSCADPAPSLFFAVDGLDECQGNGKTGPEKRTRDEEQSRVIHLLHSLSARPGFRVVLASRPEYPIQSALRGGVLRDMLHIDLNKEYDATGDIYNFTLTELQGIFYSKDSSWKVEEDARKIARHSSGQFVFATTAIRYVKDGRSNARKRLNDVLALCQPQAEGSAGITTKGDSEPISRPSRLLEPLDMLFSVILERAGQNADPDNSRKEEIERASLVWLLTRVIPSKRDQNGWPEGATQETPLWVIEEALGFERGDVSLKLSDLHSVLEIPEEPSSVPQIHVYHKSFHDFLEDSQRSGYLGAIPRIAQKQFDGMLKSQLSQVSVEDIKALLSNRQTKLPILHFLHRLCTPEFVLENIDAKVWKALLLSMTSWEEICLRDWIFVGLNLGSWEWRVNTAAEILDSRNKPWSEILPGVRAFDPVEVRPVSGAELEAFQRPVAQGNQPSAALTGAVAFPLHLKDSFNTFIGARRWQATFWASRALASLWASAHRTAPAQDSKPKHPGSHCVGRPQVVFIIEPLSPEKSESVQEFLNEAHELALNVQRATDGTGKAAVDIIILPDASGSVGFTSQVKSLWVRAGSHDTSLGYEELAGTIDLDSHPLVSLFDTLTTLWRGKHSDNIHHPQFLFQSLHLLSPESQRTLLSMIAEEIENPQPIPSPLFITVTSRPTTALVDQLKRLSGPGVYVIDLDTIRLDPLLMESLILTPLIRASAATLIEPSSIPKLIRIVTNWPAPEVHFPTMVEAFNSAPKRVTRDWLDRILAAPEPEVYRVIEELCRERKERDEETREKEAEEYRGEE